ncbi:S41 family peptidase [Flagellimonas sp. 2504JD4-2]
MKKISIPFIVLALGIFYQSLAQTTVKKVSANEQKEVIDSITTILGSSYVFPEVASKMNAHLYDKLKQGGYKNVDDPDEFAQILTDDLQSVSKDLHLRVRFDPEGISQRRNASLSAEDSIAFVENRLKRNRARNYGFKEVRILDGNIGYLNLSGFSNVDAESGAAAQAAMNFLSNVDALIIDLRVNGGGSPSMIQLITSYLYDEHPVHLNSFYNRPEDSHSQTWTLPYVPGKRSPNVDVYILTSSSTFSAAEEFSYNLRNLERATLIGEVTGGGAHPGGTQIATDRFTVWTPTGRAINPITNTNWEGVGVKPHIEVSANDALNVAKITALETLVERAGNNTDFHLQWALDGYKAENTSVTVDKSILKSYAGDYGPRKIRFDNGKLYYQREGNTQYELIPMTTSMFRIDEIPYFRIKMLEEDGKIVGVQGLYSNGRTDKSVKSGN